MGKVKCKCSCGCRSTEGTWGNLCASCRSGRCPESGHVADVDTAASAEAVRAPKGAVFNSPMDGRLVDTTGMYALKNACGVCGGIGGHYGFCPKYEKRDACVAAPDEPRPPEKEDGLLSLLREWLEEPNEITEEETDELMRLLGRGSEVAPDTELREKLKSLLGKWEKLAIGSLRARKETYRLCAKQLESLLSGP